MDFWTEGLHKKPSRFLKFSQTQLFKKFLKYIPQIEIYKSSNDACSDFVKFFNAQKDFEVVLKFIGETYDPYSIFIDKVKIFKILNTKSWHLTNLKRNIAKDDAKNSVANSFLEFKNVIEMYNDALCYCDSTVQLAISYHSIGFKYFQIKGYR